MILASDFAKAIEQATLLARETGRRQRVRRRAGWIDLTPVWTVQEVSA